MWKYIQRKWLQTMPMGLGGRKRVLLIGLSPRQKHYTPLDIYTLGSGTHFSQTEHYTPLYVHNAHTKSAFLPDRNTTLH